MKKCYFIDNESIDIIEACFSNVQIPFKKIPGTETVTIFIIDTKNEKDIKKYFDENHQNYKLTIRKDGENKNVKSIKVTYLM